MNLFSPVYTCEGGELLDLQTIPDNATEIRLVGTRMKRIYNLLFRRYAGTLEALSFSRCELLTIIDNDTFSQLPKLRSLYISNCALTTVNAAWFRNSILLENLGFEGKKIINIEKGAFRNLKNLTYFYLSDTSLGELKRSWFGNISLPSLTSFFVHNHKIDKIEKNMFGRFPNLKNVSLDNCNLTNVTFKWFADSIPVTNLSFRNNNIRALDELIDRATELTSLDVTKNRLRCLDLKYIIRALPHLKELKVSGNKYAKCKSQLQNMAESKQIMFVI